VIKHEGRDPRLLWHRPTKRWVMAVYDELDGNAGLPSTLRLTSSSGSTKAASRASSSARISLSCPVEGKPAQKLWVLTAASSEYRLGTFDGRQFTPQTPMLQILVDRTSLEIFGNDGLLYMPMAGSLPRTTTASR